MARRAEAEKAGVYAAAQQWVNAALRNDDSLFTPGEPVWTLQNIDDIGHRFSAPDAGQGGFWHRLEQQLEDAPPRAVQLVAESFYVRLLIDDARLKSTTKRDQIKRILGWANAGLVLPDQLSQVLDVGICDPGTAFNMRVHHGLQLIVLLSQNLKQMSQVHRDNVLAGPWAFQKALLKITTSAYYNQSSALLHLVYPDTFERIVSRDHKDRIANAFADRLNKRANDHDRDLLAIRGVLSEIYGRDFDFYDDDVWPVWDHNRQPDTSRWAPIIRWAKPFVEHPDFDRRERDYKLTIADNLKRARSAVEDKLDHWPHVLQQALRPSSITPDRSVEERVRTTAQLYREEQNRLTALGRRREAKEYASRASLLETTIAPMESRGTFRRAAGGRWQCRVWSQRLGRQIGATADTREEAQGLAHRRRAELEADTMAEGVSPDNDLVHLAVVDPFLLWSDEFPSEARTALLELWSEPKDFEEAVRGFLHRLPADVVGESGARTNFASFLAMAVDPRRYPPYREMQYATGYKLTGHPTLGEGADEAATYRHALGFLDSLIAEASARGLALRDRLDAESVLRSMFASGDWYKEVLSGDEHEAFADFLKQGRVMDPEEVVEPPPITLHDLASELLWDVSYLEEAERLLGDKRQVVFYGPPGTGKTYVAQELAGYFAGEHGSLDLVQFHPSYAYEEFIEGFRPALVDDQPGFKLKDGPLKRIADRARSEPNARHVLVIDEINRGNLAKVFGELYFLLEYRDREIQLQYADQPFMLPENLWIIATMNTADRSIALVDAALRRRFYFVPFFPDEPPVEGLLRRWLLEEKPTMLWVADVVDAANQILKDLDKRDMAVGPSYFMSKKLDEDWVRRIWKHSILPYVEEQLFGQTDRIEEFELDKLRAAVQRSAGAEEEAATANDQADAAPEPGDA